MVDDRNQEPYQPPAYYEPEHEVDLHAIRRKLQVPAIMLMVMSGLAIFFQSINLFIPTDYSQFEAFPEVRDMLDQNPELRNMMAMAATFWFKLVVTGFKLVTFGLIFLGGYKMYRLESWGLAVTGSILAVVPCFGTCCCLVDIPLGIWALVLLFDDEVKAAFEVMSQ